MSMFSLSELAARNEQWRRFREWERTYLRERPDDLDGTIRWFADATELAKRMDPEWGSRARLEEHVRHIGQVRAALSFLSRG